jgi:hypothetical protein
MAMRVGLDMGLYGVLVKADGQPVKAQELADACKAEKLFTGMLSVATLGYKMELTSLVRLVRIMRVLTAAGFVDEVGVETYAANELTRLMAEDVTDGVVKGSYDMPARVQVVMHNYFRERGYK